MNSIESDQEKPVLIVGAGFSGLVLARALVKRKISVRIFEREARAGGLIGTKSTPYGSVESAANGLLLTSAVQSLFQDAGVEIQRTRRESRARYIAIDGKPKRWPLKVKDTFSFLFGLMRFLFLRPPPRPFESVASFASRVLGAGAARDLVAPALLGIYADSSENLSASLILSKPKSNSQSHKRERPRGTVSAPGGMGELIRGLEKFLVRSGVEIRFNAAMSRQDIESQSKNHVVVLATSIWDAKDLTTSDEIRAALSTVEVRGLVSATLFFSSAPQIRGFGTLFRQSEAFRALGFEDVFGCLQNSSIFENRTQPGLFSETWILGPRWLSQNDQSLVHEITKLRALAFSSTETPVHFEFTRWDQALPRYGKNLEHALEVLAQSEADLLHFGNYRGEIGLSKILARADDLAEQIARQIARQIPRGRKDD